MLLDHDSHRTLREYVKALNRLYAAQPALHEVDFSWEGFQWIDVHDVDNSIVSFIRRARDPHDFVVVAANFTPVPREGYRMGVPARGVLPRAAEQRLGLVWRQQHGQRGRAAIGARLPGRASRIRY